MKDKNVAGILAIFLGAFGIHRFYLGQTGLGIFYIFLFFVTFSTLPILLGIIDAISFFSSPQEKFDIKYNRQYIDVNRRYPHDRDFNRRDRDFRRGYREEKIERTRKIPVRQEKRRVDLRKESPRRTPQRRPAPASNPFRQEGVQKFKEYDYSGAIEAFERALEINPQDIAVHFNLACAYSLMENKEEAFHHLDRAIIFGFKDTKRIREHDALAWLRIQDEFDEFAANNFKLSTKQQKPATDEPNLLDTKPDILDQIKKLGELRSKGLLTEEEFSAQKRKLMK